MRYGLSNPWTFITLSIALPVAAFSIMKWHEVVYEKLPVYRNAGTLNLSRFASQYSAPGEAYNENIRVVNFFFTSCPVICVKMMKNMKNVHDRIADSNKIKFISVSVDPERDIPEKMKQYISRLDIDDAGWQFLSGDKKETYGLARNNFAVVAAGGAGEDDFFHTDKLILLDSRGNVRGYYSGLEGDVANKLIDDIKKLKNEPPNFFVR